MARFQSVGILFVIFLTFVVGISTANNVEEERKVYIVYMGSPPKTQDYSPSSHHLDMMREAVDTRFVEKSLIRSYKRSFNGFAASLTEQERQKLNDRDDVLLVIPSQTYHLHTTASWDFMGFHQNVARNPSLESDIIVGVIDSGIWPESESFNDHGFGPVPKKWKGECDGGKNFTCNKKIIGARNYVFGESARDEEGHGTHTASTAAGNLVGNSSFFGLAKGTARGGVPSARIAAYKVCSTTACTDDAILAAFDDAIADGVDIISLSLGSSDVTSIQDDIIAIGSFNAVKKGILTVHSAGNVGNPGSVSSTAPWLFTVGASSTTRNFISKVSLGNGKKLTGTAINVFKLNGTEFPLVNAENVSFTSCSVESARQCSVGCLDRMKVKGKIVVCATTDSSTSITEVRRAGGVGVIALDDFGSWASVSPRPTLPLEQELFKQVEEYIKSTKDPKANFLNAETVKDDSAPAVASFSSRGPNGNYPDILKPDIAAPGVDILAAYPPATAPSGYSDLDSRSVTYNILSGTSMACPHVTGVAAYVKSLHPNWSPSAIKSALMTTAQEMDSSKPGNREAEFAYGAGHLNPTKAANPGLVYESLDNDYIRVICYLNISQAVTKIFGANVPCQRVTRLQAKDLNYPTLSAKVQNGGNFKVIFPRTVTNVGHQNSTYQATVSGTSNLTVTVEPRVLSFKALQERKRFTVTVEGVLQQDIQQVVSASLKWSDGIHSVRSPIVVYTDLLF